MRSLFRTSLKLVNENRTIFVHFASLNARKIKNRGEYVNGKKQDASREYREKRKDELFKAKRSS